MLDIVIMKVKSVLTDPKGFFQKLKKEKGVGDAFIFLALLSVIGLVGGIIVNILLPPPTIEGLEELATPLSAGAIVLASVIGYFLGLALSFVGAGILHIWIMIWGGKAPYTKTYQLAVYSGTPSMLFGWIPFIGMFAGIYALILLILGTPKTHNISMKKSLWMYLVPVAVLILIGILLFGVAMMFLFDAGEIGQF
jgi:hypothetical protein